MTWSRSFVPAEAEGCRRGRQMPHTLAPVWEPSAPLPVSVAALAEPGRTSASPSRTARRTVSKPRPSTPGTAPRAAGRRRGVGAGCGRAAGRRSVLVEPRRLDTSAHRDYATATTTACARPRSRCQGMTNETASSPAPISRNVDAQCGDATGSDPDEQCRDDGGARRTPRDHGGLVHCGIANLGSQASSKRSASTDTSQPAARARRPGRRDHLPSRRCLRTSADRPRARARARWR